MNHRAYFALLLTLCLFSFGAAAGPIDPAFNFAFVFGANTGFGTLNTVDQGDGSFHAIGGSMTVTGGADIGTYVLGVGGPALTASPSGHISFDNLLFPASNPELDAAGLLFIGNGLEINMIGAGSPNLYGMFTWNGTTLSHPLFENATFTTSRVPEPTTLALLGACMFGLGFSRRKQ
jgi:PEP-CTERM motif